MQIVFSVILSILGACFGSFLCCEARRLHLKEKNQKSLGSRSVCMSCKARLKWYDNIPIVSWLVLKGKCRKCGKKIGLPELLSELSMTIAFCLISTTINLSAAGLIDWLIFAFILMLTLSLGFLAIYDGIYGELPTPIIILSIILATVVLGLKEWFWFSSSAFSFEYIFNPIFSVLILGGLYLLLYLVSKGKWVGDGDWLLGVSIGLALSNPWLALIALFLANLLACIVMLPSFLKNKNHHIYFGPFLVASFIITYTFSNFLLSCLSVL